MSGRRGAWLAGVLVMALSLGASAGCVVEEQGIDAYPGSSLGPGHRTDSGEYLYLQQLYWTPDSYGEVVRFYEGYVAKEAGWSGGRASGRSVWTRNMKMHDMGGATPIDPTQEAGAIEVMSEPSRTVIRTFATFPHER